MEIKSINNLPEILEKSSDKDLEKVWTYFEILCFGGVQGDPLKEIGGILSRGILMKKKHNYYITSEHSRIATNIQETCIKIKLEEHNIDIHYIEYLATIGIVNSQVAYLDSISIDDRVWIVMSYDLDGTRRITKRDKRWELIG